MSQFGVKARVLELFYEELRRRPHIDAYIRGIGGFSAVLSLLEMPAEHVRVLGIKFISLLLHANILLGNS